MGKRIYLTLVVIVALVALLWLLWPRGRQVSVAESVQSQKPSTSLTQQAPAGEKSSATAEEVAKTPWKGTNEQKLARIAEVREVIHHANQPVSFFGQVIDQDNAPLPGVKVRLSLKRTEETLPGLSRDVLDYVDEVTSAQGGFSLTGRNGSLLTVQSLEKPGYEAPYVGNRAYWYEEIVAGQKFTPNEAKPEIFRMWKLVGAERLINKGIGTSIPYDGTAVNFDLQAGREVGSGGDIRVTLKRTPLQIKPWPGKYDWIATIEAVDGGVIASNDEFMYRAPESGYEPKLTISVSAQDPKWSAYKAVAFYLKSQSKYARVTAEFTTDYDKPKTYFRVEAYINPNGSRNLEYDPMQNIVKGSRLPPTTSGNTAPAPTP